MTQWLATRYISPIRALEVRSMNKKEFVEQLAKKASLSKKDAQATLDASLDLIIATTKKKQKVTFAGFGTFEARRQKSTTRINPQTRKPFTVPAKFTPKFRASKSFKESMPKK